MSKILGETARFGCGCLVAAAVAGVAVAYRVMIWRLLFLNP